MSPATGAAGERGLSTRMGVWSKLFGEKSRVADASVSDPADSDLALPTANRPTTVVAIPGQLTVSFHAHERVENTRGNFMSAVTHGLHEHGQRELSLTLRLDASADVADVMRQLSRFFKSVFAWARQRQFVEAGGVTQFGERALFGRSRSGLIYADARALPDVTLPSATLAAILVDASEAQTALDHGAYRVLARLGKHNGVFPFPIWSDLTRPSTSSERESESLLAKVRRTRASGVSFLVEGKRLRIFLSPSVKGVLGRGVASLPAGAPFALLTRPAPSANAWLVWHPGQREAQPLAAEGSDGTRLSGSCLFISRAAERDEIRAIEDGYLLHLSAQSWALASAALFEERSFSLALADGAALELHWQPEAESI